MGIDIYAVDKEYIKSHIADKESFRFFDKDSVANMALFEANHQFSIDALLEQYTVLLCLIHLLCMAYLSLSLMY